MTKVVKKASKSARRHPLAALLAAFALLGAGAGTAVAFASSSPADRGQTGGALGAATASTAPPAPTLTSTPANPTNQTWASFGFKDSKSGVSFLCRLDGGSFGACTSPKSYSGLSSGSHTFSVEAKDSGGATSGATSFTWRIDTTPPPAPTLTTTPPNPQSAADASSTFAWSDSDPDGDALTYVCSIDGAAPKACSSPTSYDPGKLGQGAHTFSVSATEAPGNQSAAASFSWTVVQPIKTFSISGNAPITLIPGAGTPLNLTIANPNNYSITVTSITVTISSVTKAQNAPAGTCAKSDFQVANYSGGGFTAPSGSSTLAGDGVPVGQRPTVSMLSSNSSQDACKGATVNLAYQGIATK